MSKVVERKIQGQRKRVRSGVSKERVGSRESERESRVQGK